MPPEWLLRGLVLQDLLYGIRSERLLCEQLGYNMLFRWFVLGLAMEDAAWDHSAYSEEPRPADRSRHNQDAFAGVMQQAEDAEKPPSPTEHFSVDGTLIRAWAALRELRTQGRSAAGQGRQQE